VKKYFAQLRPLERRLAVGVMVVLFLVLNAVFVWPHHSDWGDLQARLKTAHQNLDRDQAVLLEQPKYDTLVKNLEGQGEVVAPEDMAVNMMRTIQSQSAQSGVQLLNTSRQVPKDTDEFFSQQIQNINVSANDEQLVDFLYKLGSGASMIRVRDLELQTDPSKTRLNARIALVASYQKNATANNLKPATGKAK
jgi:Tfp pilus assembly protein PilO